MTSEPTVEKTPFFEAYKDFNIPDMVAAARPVASRLALEGLSNQLYAFGGLGDDLVQAIDKLTGTDDKEPCATASAAMAIGIAIGQMMPEAFTAQGDRR